MHNSKSTLDIHIARSSQSLSYCGIGAGDWRFCASISANLPFSWQLSHTDRPGVSFGIRHMQQRAVMVTPTNSNRE